MAAQFDYDPYYAILFVIALVLVITLAMAAVAHLVRPARKGPIKDSTYESGMPVIGDARRRFNVRFYVVALLFLLFDVEIVFLWPWAMAYYRAATGEEGSAVAGQNLGPGYLLAAMALFVAFLVVGYGYEWLKGVFQWD